MTRESDDLISPPTLGPARAIRRPKHSGARALAVGALALLASAGPVQVDPAPLPDGAFEDFGMRLTTGYRSDTFRQQFQWGPGGAVLYRTRMERAIAADPWVIVEAPESVSYTLTAVASTDGGDTLFVAGFTAEGTTVVERWDFPERPQGWRARAATPTGPIGVPAPPPGVTQGVAGGSIFEAPGDDGTLLPADRQVLFERATGPINSMTVDPQGRYLVFHDFGTAEIVQRTLDTGAEQVLLSGTDYPPLLQDVSLVELRDFAGEGRKLFVRGAVENAAGIPERMRAIVPDADNDGLFELGPTAPPPVFFLGDDLWEQSPYADWSNWDLYWHG